MSMAEPHSFKPRFSLTGTMWLGVLTAVSFLLYLLTMCPTVYLGDAGELTVAGIQLGTPHPPGYPLSTILMHVVMCVMPLGSLAFRANLLSVLAAITTLLFLAKLVEALMGKDVSPTWRWPIACAVSLSYGMSRVFWSQALITEVYTVMMMVFMAMMWMIYESTRKNYLGPLLAAGCLYAFGFVQHPTLWLYGPVIAAWVAWLAWSKWRTPWVLVVIFIASIIPLAMYIYFPLRSLTNPGSDWGNPENLHRILRHVLRKQYRAVGVGPRSWELFFGQMAMFWQYLCEQLTGPLVLIALAGLASLWRVSKSWGFGFSILFLLSTLGGVFLLNYQPTLHQKELIGVFFLPAVALLTVGLGLATGRGLHWLHQRRPSWTFVGVLLCCALPLPPLAQSWRENNHSRNTIAYFSAIDMLNAFPRGAHLFTAGDFTAFPLAYLTMGEGRRTDIHMFDDYGSLFPNLYGDGFLELPGPEQGNVRKNIQKTFLHDPDLPLYTTLGAEMSNWAPRLIPEGINYRVLPEHVSWPLSKFHVESAVYALWTRFNGHDTPTQNILNQYAFARGEYFFVTDRPDRGLRWYQWAVAHEREYEWLANNIATMLPRRMRGPDVGHYVAWFYERILMLNPWYSQASVGLGNLALSRAAQAKAQGETLVANRYYREAQERFKQSTEGEPNPGAYYLMGNAYADQGNHKEAVDAYIKCLSWDPNNPSAHKNLAFSLMELGQRDAALAETARAIALSPQDYQLYYNKGAIELQLNRLAEAETSWRQAYQLNPKDPRISQGLMLLQHKREGGGGP